MLEIGPGPGAATEWLRQRVGRLTAVEVDAEAARRLADKFPERNVSIVTGSATELGYPDESPAGLLSRLQTPGFEDITIAVDRMLKFVAHRPAAAEAEEAQS
jgi:16S rRNA A1518/A1519 N6-dimethyltransferase RsmA/KsgA/DIM1 with predicted DNA glycosylase/AP lyase activity